MSASNLLKETFSSELSESTVNLSLYDLSVKHPQKWVVRFGKVLYYEYGVMDVLEPSEKREAVFTIMWRPYQELFRYHSPEAQEVAEKKGPSSRVAKQFYSTVGMEQAPLSTEEIPVLHDSGQDEKIIETLYSYRETVEKGLRSDFANFEKLTDEVTWINGHPAIYEEVKFKVKKGLIRRFKANIKRQQVYTVCPLTKRLIVLHTSVDISQVETYGKYFDYFLSNFKCHE